MEDDLNFFKKGREDNLNFFLMEDDPHFSKMKHNLNFFKKQKTTSIFPNMKDDLNFGI